jgi:hypothetical protein
MTRVGQLLAFVSQTSAVGKEGRRVLSRLGLLVVPSVACAFLASCGGGGGGGNPFAGTYSANYSRQASGAFTIFVAANGSVEVCITDSSGGVFTGTGTVSPEGALSATATNAETGQSLTVTGQFVGQGDTATASGSISGSFSVSWTAQQIAPPGGNAFAGSYSGTYWGDISGTWTGTVQSNGSVTAQATEPGEDPVPLTGTVSPAGAGTMEASGSGPDGEWLITWSGTFRMEPGGPACSGDWESTSGESGGWSD